MKLPLCSILCLQLPALCQKDLETSDERILRHRSRVSIGCQEQAVTYKNPFCHFFTHKRNPKWKISIVINAYHFNPKRDKETWVTRPKAQISVSTTGSVPFSCFVTRANFVLLWQLLGEWRHPCIDHNLEFNVGNLGYDIHKAQHHAQLFVSANSFEEQRHACLRVKKDTHLASFWTWNTLWFNLFIFPKIPVFLLFWKITLLRKMVVPSCYFSLLATCTGI